MLLKDDDAFEGIGTMKVISSSLLFKRRRHRNNNDACDSPIWPAAHRCNPWSV
jgi:hypothetical protein